MVNFLELHEQILCETIAREVIPALCLNPKELLEAKCYQTILRIYEIVSEERLDDPECFQRIEEIVCALDDLGIGGGGRHDF